MSEDLSKTAVAKKTFFFDNLRCFFAGIVEAGFKNFAFVIAIRVFHASSHMKSFTVSAMSMGFFVTPIFRALAVRSKMTTMQISAIYMLIVASLIVSATFMTSCTYYIIPMLCAMILFRQPIPLMEDVYGQNYPANERGRRLSTALMILPLSALLLSPALGKILDINLKTYKLVLLVIAMAAVGESISFRNIPARVLPEQNGKSIFSNFDLVFTDKLFGKMLFCLILAGMANRIIIPLRVEYLVNPKYDIKATVFFETLVCLTIPYAFRVLSSRVWGKIFDKTKLTTTLVVLNCMLIFNFLVFFHTSSNAIISLVSVLTGIAFGGKEIIWSLWLTKLAPIDKLSAYAGVSFAISGLCGIISPHIGYFLLKYLSIQEISTLASLLTLLSTIGFLLLSRQLHQAKC